MKFETLLHPLPPSYDILCNRCVSTSADDSPRQVMHLCVWSLLLCLANASAKVLAPEIYPYQPHAGSPGASRGDTRFCFVVRTFWGHTGPDGLLHFLHSLQGQPLQG